MMCGQASFSKQWAKEREEEEWREGGARTWNLAMMPSRLRRILSGRRTSKVWIFVKRLLTSQPLQLPLQ